MTYRKIFIVTLLGCLLFTACHPRQELPYYLSPDLTPVWDIDSVQGPLHRIPAFSFEDQNEQVVTNRTFDNKVYVVNFFFTSCNGICPRMMKNLLKVQKAFAGNEQVAFLSHTVTPWIDSIPRLKAYARKYGMDKRWHLVTGDKAAIYKLARQSYFAEDEPGFIKDSTEFLHTEHVLLIDKNKHIRGVYNGTLPLEANRLIADIRTLLKEG